MLALFFKTIEPNVTLIMQETTHGGPDRACRTGLDESAF